MGQNDELPIRIKRKFLPFLNFGRARALPELPFPLDPLFVLAWNTLGVVSDTFHTAAVGCGISC